MDFFDVLAARYSVREFDRAVEVDDETVEQLLAAAIRAPSAGNMQPWHFYVVRDAAVRQALAEAAHGQAFVAEAPVVIVVCADPDRSVVRYGQRGRELYCLQDTAVATTHILLAATALGLGACWVGAFNERLAAAALDLSERLRPVAILPIGKPAGEPLAHSSRRPLDTVVTRIG